jgi:acyl-CoA reductase-like NAD-dependent aldehyde dehydrogenase
MEIAATLHALGVTLREGAGPTLAVHSPIDGLPLASLQCQTRAEVDTSIARAMEAFWSGGTSLPHNVAPWSVSSARRCVPSRNPSPVS